MEALPVFFFFLLGAIVASFVGVLVARFNTGEGFLAGRSCCDACGAPLAPSALVPILSFFAFSGRARCCGVRLSLEAPLAELALGGLFALAYLKVGFSAALPFLLVALAALLALAWYDLAHQILPPEFLAIFIAAGGATEFLSAPALPSFLYTLSIAFGIGLFLALIHLLSRGRAMGLSDAPLAFGLALLAGPAALPGFVFSFWIGALVGIALLARRPRGLTMKSEVPFAPFLAAGFLLAYFTQWNPLMLAAVLP